MPVEWNDKEKHIKHSFFVEIKVDDRIIYESYDLHRFVSLNTVQIDLLKDGTWQGEDCGGPALEKRHADFEILQNSIAVGGIELRFLQKPFASLNDVKYIVFINPHNEQQQMKCKRLLSEVEKVPQQFVFCVHCCQNQEELRSFRVLLNKNVLIDQKHVF